MAPLASSTDLAITLDLPVNAQGVVLAPGDRLVQAVERASGAIRGFCGWTISQETVTGFRVSARGRPSVWLPTLHLTDVASVKENGRLLVAGVDYDWFGDGRLLRLSGTWPGAPRGLEVAFTHGYPAGDPRLDAVRDACLAVAVRIYENPRGFRSETETVGAVSHSWTAAGPGVGLGAGLSAAETAALAPYMLPVVA